MISKPYEVINLLSQDIRTAGAASDWLAASLGTVTSENSMSDPR